MKETFVAKVFRGERTALMTAADPDVISAYQARGLRLPAPEALSGATR